jgi:hypothetical protein
MPVPDESEVKSVLEDFHDRIRLIVDGAWSEWNEFPGRGKLVFEPRARAVLVFDYIPRRAIEQFDGDKSIRVLVKKQTIQFLFKDRVLLRFKKGNAKGMGSNIRTQAVLDFIDPQRIIPGLVPEIMKVEVCYSVDDLGVNLDEVEVIARDDTSRIWAYPLDPSGPAASVIPFPPRAPDPLPPTVLPRQSNPEEKSDDKR